MMQVADPLKMGHCYRVIDLNHCNPLYRKRLIAMGFTPGSTFELTRLAPLGDPIEIKIKGYSVALRRKELLTIHFEAVITNDHTEC